jgi:ankyrin repeat protein
MFALLVATVLAAAPAQAGDVAAKAPSARAPAPQSATLPSPARRQELLFEAAKLGRADLIPVLVRNGADVNGYESRGFTPLILAAYNGQADAVEALIKAGANACKPDLTQGNTAQMGVAFKGDDRIAARLLKEKCDVNARNKAGQTALMMASLFGRTAQIDMLLKAGADKTLLDNSGRSAAGVAAAQGNAPVAQKLSRP